MATGRDAAFGFAIWDKVIRQGLYAVPASTVINVYHQDIVIHGGAHLATARGGYLPIIRTSAVPDGVAGLLGSVTAIFDEDMDPVKYIAATEAGDAVVAGYIMVADSPDQLFVCQDNATIALASGGMNANIVSQTICAGTAATGISLQEINATGVAETAALNLKIVRPHPLDTAAAAYCRYIVQINEHYYGDTMAGIA